MVPDSLMTKEKYGELENPNTTSERLRALYQNFQPGEAVPPKVAAHPNTPADILAALFSRYTDVILANSVFPLILIEEPRFFQKQNKTTLLKLLSKPDLPEYVVEFLLRHEKAEIREVAKAHVALGEVVVGWEQEAVKCIGFLKHDRRDVAELNILEKGGFVPNWLQGALKAVTINDFSAPNSLPTDTSPLTEEDQKYLGWDVARWSRKVEVLRLIESKVDRNLNTPLLYNRHTPSDVLEKLARRLSGNRIGMIRIVMHPNTQEKLLRTLAQDQSLRQTSAEEEYLWQAFTQNPNMPPDILQTIATTHNDNDGLCIALLNNPSTPEETWKTIVEKYLHTIMTSLRCDHAEYGHMRFEHSTLVARLPIAFLLEYYKTGERRSMAGHFLCLHPDTPLQVRRKAIRTYYRNHASLLTWFVLLLTETDSTRLSSAIKARWWQIRFAVAINPNVERDHLEILAKDANRYVRAAARARLADASWRFSG
jgi:hypothetical protein